MWHLFSLMLMFRPVAHRCCLSVWDLSLFYLSTVLRQRFSAALVPVTLPSIAMRFPRLCYVRVSRRDSSRLCFICDRERVRSAWEGGDPPSLACASALTFSFGSDGLRWFHAPAGYNDLHHMSVNPVVSLGFRVFESGGSPSALSTMRFARRWPSSVSFVALHRVPLASTSC